MPPIDKGSRLMRRLEKNKILIVAQKNRKTGPCARLKQF
ncbi:hypothetical protein MNBD_ALPHA11-1472 [hydrothermal vent metagenome]|uniref:Uncharacterized protein n=1 Tax=hydrothermal vent metagenome TaxID=652676 RepID=A0A3B0U7Z9_9ZZZZ